MKYKNILITGGEGFIGFNLCKELITTGAKVTSLDINLSGRVDRRVNGVNYIVGDTNNILDIFKDEKFDLIYHLGEYSRVENSYANIDIVNNSNISGTAKVLEFWRQQNCKLVYAGSSTKFSKYLEEDDGNLNKKNISPYAFTKATNTELVKMYAEWFNLSHAITYFYNVYGEKENEIGEYATLIGIFKRKIENNKSLEIVLPGTQKRNFTDIRDIVNGLILIGDKGEGDNFGIGSDEEFSILEIAEFIKEKYGNEIIFLPERNGNRMSSLLITKKTKELGWVSNYKLKDYIINILVK